MKKRKLIVTTPGAAEHQAYHCNYVKLIKKLKVLPYPNALTTVRLLYCIYMSKISKMVCLFWGERKQTKGQTICLETIIGEALI